MAHPPTESLHNLPLQPMLLPYLFHFHSGDGSVFILAPQRTYHLRLPGTFAHVADKVLQLLNGSCTLPQLVEAVQASLPDSQPEMVIAVLQYLYKQGLLVDGAASPPSELPGEAIARWQRNLSFFSAFERPPQTRYDYQVALRHGSVALIGLGGTGSWIASALAMAGVGCIVGVDGDRVETSNLNRQVLYRPQDVGRLKTEVTAEALAGLAPEMAFTGVCHWMQSEDDVAQAIGGCDLVLLTADQPMGLISRWTNAACFALGIPMLASGIAARWATVGPLYVPGLTGCWECVDADKRRRSRHYAEMFQTLAERRAPAPPSLAPLCALVGAQAAYEAIEYLTGFARPATLGCELITDTLTMNVKRNRVRQRSGCRVCGTSGRVLPDCAARLPAAQRNNLVSQLVGRFLVH